MSRLIIVEDNERSRYLLEQFLHAKGYVVASAENGAVALEMIRENPPDLVVSDIMMPVMNGYRLCRELKRDGRLKHIPLVFYTATFVEKEDERLAMSLGAFRFVVKPADEAELEAVIRDALNQQRPRDESSPTGEPRDLDGVLDLYDNSVARKLAEKVDALQEEKLKLGKSELRLKVAQEIAQVGHWEYDLKADKFIWSDEVCRIFGFKPSETDFSQEQMFRMVHPEDRDLVERSYRSLLQQMMAYDITYRILLADGSIRFVNERGQTLCNDLGTPLAALGTVQNITEQKTVELELERYKGQLEGIVEERTQQLRKAHEELVKHERMALLGQLATTVSHELRNPLGTIGNVIDLIDHVLKSGNLELLPGKLQLASRNIDRCDRIISELLEFSNSKPPKTSRFVFDEQLEKTLDDLDWPEDVACERSLSANVEVTLDPVLLHRIINNVVSNSLQALATVERTEKKVRIETRVKDRDLTVSVQDNGPGISTENLDKIFEPLYSTKPFGVGLGMSIVKNAVKHMNGSIEIDSEAGAGTTITIAFPT